VQILHLTSRDDLINGGVVLIGLRIGHKTTLAERRIAERIFSNLDSINDFKT
jgi:hypothetical protein